MDLKLSHALHRAVRALLVAAGHRGDCDKDVRRLIRNARCRSSLALELARLFPELSDGESPAGAQDIFERMTDAFSSVVGLDAGNAFDTRRLRDLRWTHVMLFEHLVSIAGPHKQMIAIGSHRLKQQLYAGAVHSGRRRRKRHEDLVTAAA